MEIPPIKEWYEGLKGDTKLAARKFFGRVNVISGDDKHRKTLFKYGVLAFTHLRHKELINELDDIKIENLETTVKLFSCLDDIEASWYHEITKSRLEVIKKLSQDVSDNVRERVVQEHIYNHLWLLDPSWDRATETPTLEQTVTQSFSKISDELNDEEKKGRIDIRYKKTSGKHVIIELKKSSVIVNHMHVMVQVVKYKKALKKQLALSGENGPIEIICLVGKLPSGWDNSEDREQAKKVLAAADIRIITYQQLIKEAELSYQQYLEKNKKIGELQTLLTDIDEFEIGT